MRFAPATDSPIEIPAVEHQLMTHKDAGHSSEHVTAETTAAFRAEHLAELHAPAPPGAERAASGFDGLPSGSALVVVKRGPNVGSQFVLDQPSTTAGRDPRSDIFLDDITVSRHHAEFRLENGEFRIVDAGSLNGTYVNRHRVDCAVLADGDEIQIGNFRLVFLALLTTQ
jgi:pSer/pThr/pTyr-binding forkhead associated (FHA) protein